jgi:hypothetical protein
LKWRKCNPSIRAFGADRIDSARPAPPGRAFVFEPLIRARVLSLNFCLRIPEKSQKKVTLGQKHVPGAAKMELASGD